MTQILKSRKNFAKKNEVNEFLKKNLFTYIAEVPINDITTEINNPDRNVAIYASHGHGINEFITSLAGNGAAASFNGNFSNVSICNGVGIDVQGSFGDGVSPALFKFGDIPICIIGFLDGSYASLATQNMNDENKVALSTAENSIEATNDILIAQANFGIILIDRTTNNKYRLFINNGVLDKEIIYES
jgi:hypothetical protein